MTRALLAVVLLTTMALGGCGTKLSAGQCREMKTVFASINWPNNWHLVRQEEDCGVLISDQGPLAEAFYKAPASSVDIERLRDALEAQGWRVSAYKATCAVSGHRGAFSIFIDVLSHPREPNQGPGPFCAAPTAGYLYVHPLLEPR